MIWARMLAYITGTVDQELLLRNEYLAADRPPARTEGLGRIGGCREAGDAAGLVPKAHRQEVRRIEVSQILGSSQS
jgi:hypothetical protein